MVEVQGVLLDGLLGASRSLDIVLEVVRKEYEPARWYPICELNQLTDGLQHYAAPGAILRQLGTEMIAVWHKYGPGKSLVDNGLDFLHFQTGSAGYRSVIRGPEHQVGRFDLVQLDLAGGTAQVISTSPFPRDMEHGILLGGLGLSDDLYFYDVDYDSARNCFHIKFVSADNLSTLSWHTGAPLAPLQWRLCHLKHRHEAEAQYWHAIHETLHAAYARLRVQATTDDLTGTLNRREFKRVATLEFERARRYRHELAVLFLDLDRYKSINDEHGHDCGDDVLRRVGALLRAVCRQTDVIGRLGGDEFAVLCLQASLSEAMQLGERLIAEVRALTLEHRGAQVQLTLSMGAASLRATHADVGELVVDADRALLAAKQAGRDRLVTLPIA